MKKFVSIFFAILLASVMCVTAFAAPNNFVSSPEADNDTTLDGSDNITDGCDAVVVLTTFADRANLDDASRKNLEDARDAIVDSDDLTKLCADLDDKSDASLSVSDIFDIDYTENGSHDGHDGFTIRVKTNSLDKLVAVMNYDGGEWTLVDASVNADGLLEIKTAKTGAFAVVIENEQGETSNPNQTGDDFRWWIYVALMVVCAGALLFIGIKLKKSE